MEENSESVIKMLCDIKAAVEAEKSFDSISIPLTSPSHKN